MSGSRRILLTSYGSLGDLHPYLAVAIALKARGHLPTIATCATFRERVESEGVGFAPLRPDEREWDEAAVMRDIMDERRGPEYLLRELILPELEAMCEDIVAASEDVDLIIGHPITFPAPLVAKKRGIPWMGVALAPVSLFSAHDWPVMSRAFELVRRLPLGARRFLREMAVRMIDGWMGPVRDLARRLGVPPPAGTPLFDGQYSEYGNLALFSRHFAAPQPDWPPAIAQPGYSFYDGPGDAAMSPDLSAFLEAGEPPIVFTLGSAAVLTAGGFYAKSVDAARILGRRALLLIGRDPRNRPAEPLPAGIAVFEYAPYAQLFPRAVAIVHQGGSGTMGQAIRAGRPSLVVPWAHDQPDNGARAVRLGIARILRRGRYGGRSAAREIGALLADPAYSARAAHLGELVRSEDGAAGAAEAIERVLD